MKTWKVLDHRRKPYHGGVGQWPKPGEWLEFKGELVACKNGLHLCRKKDLVLWLGPEIWEAKYSGEIVKADDKIIVRKAMLVKKLPWNAKIARLFAADCAEHVLPLFEKEHPKDHRPRLAIQAARRFIRGKVTRKELYAAKDAARAAAWAARDAACAAAVGARDATWAACAAGAAGGDGEMKWQTKRLFQYLYPESEELDG